MPKLATTKFGLKKLEISLYRVTKMRVDILNRLDVAHKCQTDRRTDRTDPLRSYGNK